MSDFFKLQEHGTSVGREIMAGATTFAAMAYILVVNPQIMAIAGIDQGASFVATCLAAALSCLLMGLYANWPVGLAPGMGLNALFAYTIVGDMGYPWQTGLGAVFIAGVLFVIISTTRIRAWIIMSIPDDLKIGMTAGVGLFIGIIGLQNGGIIADHPATLVTMGDFSQIPTALAALSFLLVAVLSARLAAGGLILGILTVTVLGILLGEVTYQGIVSAPPPIAPLVGQIDIMAALNVSLVSVIFSILIVNLFDTTGTLVGVATNAGLVDEEGNYKNFSKALKADSTSSVLGALLGNSPVTSYVESAAGVAAGGRTGLTACAVGVFFLLAIFFAPLAMMIPSFAVSGALIYVALLMCSGLGRLSWDNPVVLIPALLIMIMIPLTFSIADGIGIGFISYVALSLLASEERKVRWGALVIAGLFVIKFALL
ncbi:MAG: NCS2 family permease [Pseudomonadota bacterium]|nr:NCS2 family permease [Pseudomonadota bacterium]